MRQPCFIPIFIISINTIAAPIDITCQDEDKDEENSNFMKDKKNFTLAARSSNTKVTLTTKNEKEFKLLRLQVATAKNENSFDDPDSGEIYPEFAEAKRPGQEEIIEKTGTSITIDLTKKPGKDLYIGAVSDKANGYDKGARIQVSVNFQ